MRIISTLLAAAVLMVPLTARAENYCNLASNVGCFLMEDSTTETDRGGNTSNDLSVSAGDTIPTSGDFKFGSASRDFDGGQREWLYHADGLETDLTTSAFTIVCWIKPESFTDQHTIISKFNQFVGQQYQLRIETDGSAKCYTNTSSGQAEAISATSAIGTGTWHHVACVYDGTDIRIYIDGSLSSAANNPLSQTGTLEDSDAIFAIGSRFGSDIDADQTDGLMDDIAIFSSALNSTQIADIIANGLVGSGGGGGGGAGQRWLIID